MHEDRSIFDQMSLRSPEEIARKAEEAAAKAKAALA